VFVPKLATTLKGRTRQQATADVTAGGVVYDIVQKHGVAGLTVATLMAGAILV